MPYFSPLSPAVLPNWHAFDSVQSIQCQIQTSRTMDFFFFLSSAFHSGEISLKLECCPLPLPIPTFPPPEKRTNDFLMLVLLLKILCEWMPTWMRCLFTATDLLVNLCFQKMKSLTWVAKHYVGKTRLMDTFLKHEKCHSCDTHSLDTGPFQPLWNSFLDHHHPTPPLPPSTDNLCVHISW